MPTSPQVRPAVARVHPAGQAAALFAVCEPQLAGRRLTVDGRRVIAIPCDRFSLLVSYVDPSVYAPEELDRHRDDAAWQAAEARVYERAVERASRYGALLPMRSLTIVETGGLEAYAREHALRWTRSLARLGKQRECAVHVFAGPHATLARDEPYTIRIARRVARSGRLPRLTGSVAVTSLARDVWHACTSVARATRRIEPVRSRGLLWSAALLLEDGGVPAIAKILERATLEGSPLGLRAYLEGPRAPFSFA